MRLRPLSLSDEKQALQGHAELATENWEYLLGYTENLPWAVEVYAQDDCEEKFVTDFIAAWTKL